MKKTTDPDGLSARQRAFVVAMVGTKPNGKPMPAGRAYEAAGYEASGSSADSCASLLLRNPKVFNAVKKARRELAESNQFEKWQLVEFLTRAITTPVGEVDENSDLAQEVVRDEIADTVVRARVKMTDKLGAAKQLATLLNWNAPEESTNPVSVTVVIGGNQE